MKKNQASELAPRSPSGSSLGSKPQKANLECKGCCGTKQLRSTRAGLNPALPPRPFAASTSGEESPHAKFGLHLYPISDFGSLLPLFLPLTRQQSVVALTLSVRCHDILKVSTQIERQRLVRMSL